MSSDMIKRLSYAEFLNELKERIRTAQNKAVLSINAELISLYWDIGRRIVESQEKSAWGKGVVEQLAGDLRREFPDVKGFSARNLWDMRRFYLAYNDHPNLRQAVAEIPWGHNRHHQQSKRPLPKTVVCSPDDPKWMVEERACPPDRERSLWKAGCCHQNNQFFGDASISSIGVDGTDDQGPIHLRLHHDREGCEGAGA
ncbi:MAG: hypothetical protein KAU52_05205 [Methanosarcinales archaeon]|nr:hypothetical protein [Methanosarcinales archaeon]